MKDVKETVDTLDDSVRFVLSAEQLTKAKRGLTAQEIKIE